MHGATHLVYGLAVGVLVLSPMLSPVEKVSVVVASGLGALLPDIDSPGSTLVRWFSPLKIFSIVGHRGIFHSWVLPTIFAIGIWRLGNTSIWGLLLQFLLLGYFSHLILDSFNPSGIPLFWPLPRAVRMAPLKFCVKSGGFIDWGLMFLGTLLLAILINVQIPGFLPWLEALVIRWIPT